MIYVTHTCALCRICALSTDPAQRIMAAGEDLEDLDKISADDLKREMVVYLSDERTFYCCQ